MKLAIMQPYLFPYLGYFQLLAGVDEFVVFDTVQYIQRGWINRNFLKVNGEKKRFTFSLKGASSHEPINQREFSEQFLLEKQAFFQTLKHWYRQAPHYAETMALLEAIFDYSDLSLSAWLTHQLQQIANYLNLTITITLASDLPLADEFEPGAQARILKICQIKQATHYRNLPGGIDLYQPEAFEQCSIRLEFLQSDLLACEYPQGSGEFIPGLSIIDALMHNSPEQVNEILMRCQWQTPAPLALNPL